MQHCTAALQQWRWRSGAVRADRNARRQAGIRLYVARHAGHGPKAAPGFKDHSSLEGQRRQHIHVGNGATVRERGKRRVGAKHCRADGFGQGTTVSDAPAYFGSLIKLFRSAFTLTELVTASVHREGVFFSSPKLSFIESFELHRPCRSNRSARYAMPPEVPRGLLDEPTLF